MTVLSTSILSAENANSLAIDSTNTRLKQSDETIYKKYTDIFAAIEAAARNGLFSTTHAVPVLQSDLQELVTLLEKYGYQVIADQTQLTISWS